MLFNSVHFLIFFAIVTLAFFALPHRWRWAWLLAASCYFYMAFIPIYILILAFTILIDYTAGLLIAHSQGNRRKWMLIMSLIANIGVLALFKYYAFIDANLALLGRALGWNYPAHILSIILPIGLSFHTFQSMSYTIEVYRGNVPPERHLGVFALYVMFYPQLVAGPIERPQHLLPQFHEKKIFNYERATSGLRLMTWGFFKKVVVADSLAVYANRVYSNPHHYEGVALILATVFFAFQIYCDFSGYSDIARGSARVMGFELMKNFDRPYSSSSISEFWTRWHISLSTWFKDYLYIPLGGSRYGTARTCFNLLLTFMISGLWHGANWTFVFWGLLNGLYLVGSLLTRPLREHLRQILQLDRVPRLNLALSTLSTFILICFSWVFFRASSFSDAFYVLASMFKGVTHWSSQIYLGEPALQFWMSVLAMGVLLTVEFVNSRRRIETALLRQPAAFRWGVYVAAVILILNAGTVSELPFIYFQF